MRDWPEDLDRWSVMQAVCLEWSMSHWPDGSIQRDALGLAEETGEVCRAVLKRADGIRGTHEQWTAELRKEMCDVQIILLKMAEREGFNLLDETKLRLAEILGRDINHHPIGTA